MSGQELRAPATRTFGALVNPNSRRNRKIDAAALSALGPNIEMTNAPGDAPAALGRLAEAGVDVVAVSGGDGAVMTALSAILIDGAFGPPPILCLLPSGTTNMTAGDIGLQATLAETKALTESGGGRIVSRPVIRLDNVRDADGVMGSHAGMFFGAIGICRAIAFCRAHLHSRGVVGAGASWLTLLPLLLKNLTTASENGVLAPTPAAIRVLDADGEEIELLEGPWSVLMASTLEKLVMGARPFWGSGEGPAVDATFVRAPPPRLARNIRPLLFGKEKRPPEPGYQSRKAAAFEITHTGQVTLDGELFDADAATPLRLSVAGEIEFLVK
jgi:hypothetical protein